MSFSLSNTCKLIYPCQGLVSQQRWYVITSTFVFRLLRCMIVHNRYVNNALSAPPERLMPIRCHFSSNGIVNLLKVVSSTSLEIFLYNELFVLNISYNFSIYKLIVFNMFVEILFPYFICFFNILHKISPVRLFCIVV